MKIAAVKYILIQEIKFPYKKKQTFNESLYKTHLECVKTWHNLWQYMKTAINHELEIMMNTL
jgi:hypothetical protein